ncbi:MAG: hypothetical protein QNJ12_22845 [Ilumatobacter sp.]|uniref:hypothetical protein n=1 Tax=Ilumatobacter sp. TaxID=1967498 RepID=UPI00261DFBF4|nr:hypothetical protein [Ilumatobacter sp.]MDJ0771642.1 hypothetical protein [Ilumatobacter sp.]
MTTDGYLLWSARYVHRNALELPGVAAISDHRWSSYRTYLGLRRAPAFVNTDLILEHFDGDLARFRAFTEEDHTSTLLRQQPEDVRQLVDAVVACDDLRAGDDHRDRSSRRSRDVLVLLTESCDDEHVRRLIDLLLAFPSGGARRTALSRARRRLASDPAVGRVLDEVERHLAA